MLGKWLREGRVSGTGCFIDHLLWHDGWLCKSRGINQTSMYCNYQHWRPELFPGHAHSGYCSALGWIFGHLCLIKDLLPVWNEQIQSLLKIAQISLIEKEAEEAPLISPALDSYFIILRAYEFKYKDFLEAWKCKKNDLIIQETWPKPKGFMCWRGKRITQLSKWVTVCHVWAPC